MTADLFITIITTSAISSSIIQAVMSKIPAACFVSSGEPKEEKGCLSSQLINWFKIGQTKYPDLLKPYLVFPVGWREILAFIFEKILTKIPLDFWTF